MIYCNLENFEMYSFIFFSPTLYVGEYEHGFFATNSLVDEATVTVAVSTNAFFPGSKEKHLKKKYLHVVDLNYEIQKHFNNSICYKDGKLYCYKL